jgi:hypothetical protein
MDTVLSQEEIQTLLFWTISIVFYVYISFAFLAILFGMVSGGPMRRLEQLHAWIFRKIRLLIGVPFVLLGQLFLGAGRGIQGKKGKK